MIKNLYNQVLNQIQTIYAERGFKHLLKRLFNYVLMQFIDIGYTYKLDLDKIEYIPPSKGLTFERMTIHNLDSIFRDHPDEINEQTYLDLLEKLKDSNFNGFNMKKDGEICGYCFINYGTTFPILKTQYVDERNNGYLCTDYVFKKYRIQKIQQYEIYNRLQKLKKKNYKTATGLVEKYNYPSRASIEKFGFKKCVICYFFRFGNLIRSKEHYKII